MLCVLLAFLVYPALASTTKTPCNESLPTIAFVRDCPRNKRDWIERSQLKKCDAVKQDCTVNKNEFGYHCLLNEWGNATLEVCAPERLIIGHCGEYNSGRTSIQDSHISCKSCPGSYSSRDAYLYSECYDHPLKMETIGQGKFQSETMIGSYSTLLGILLGGFLLFVLLTTIIAVVIILSYRHKILDAQGDVPKKNNTKNSSLPTLAHRTVAEKETEKPLLENKSADVEKNRKKDSDTMESDKILP